MPALPSPPAFTAGLRKDEPILVEGRPARLGGGRPLGADTRKSEAGGEEPAEETGGRHTGGVRLGGSVVRDNPGLAQEAAMVPLILIGAAVLGACLVFGYSSSVVGFVLMAAGVLGLITFMATPGMVRRPGEREVVIDERHYIGDHDDHRHYRW